MGLGDQVGKQAADELTTLANVQLPQLEKFVAEQLALVRSTVQQIVSDAKQELEMVVGQSLQAVTAERTEAIMQFENAVHGVLDRVTLNVSITPRK